MVGRLSRGKPIIRNTGADDVLVKITAVPLPRLALLGTPFIEALGGTQHSHITRKCNHSRLARILTATGVMMEI